MKLRSVLLLDTQPVTHNYYITLAIADALRQSPHVDRVVLATHGDAIRRFEDERLDTVLAFGGSEAHTDILARLCRRAELSILWTTEDPYQLAGNVATSTCFDLVFTNDKASVAAYGGRAHHLPLAASALFQDHPVPEVDASYFYDLLFIGTAWPNRVRSLNAILDRSAATRKVKLALPWNEFIGPPDIGDRDLIMDWRCANRDFARFANRSRITLTLPRHFSAASVDQAIGSTPPPRLFETALAGGFQIVVSPEAETSDYYEPGREILTGETDEDAIAAIDAMLNDPGARMAMAARARCRTQQEHLYGHRIARMLDIALGGGRPRREVAAPKRDKVVLFVSHNRLGRLPGGGVEIYQELLAEHLRGYEVLFLYPALQNGKTVLCLDRGGVSRHFDCATMTSERLSDRGVEAVFADILVEHEVDLVHFHHLLNLPLSLPLISRALGIPSLWHLHDYYLICDRLNLLTRDRRFCDVAGRGSGQCDGCLGAMDGRPPGSKARRDGLTARIAGSFDAVIASTPWSGDYLTRFFPEIDRRRVHILDLPSTSTSPAAARPSTREPTGETLVVAVPGNFTDVKGADDLIDIIRLCADYDIRFEIFGRVQDVYTESLLNFDQDRVKLHHGYERDEIVGLMAGCDISLHVSIWPETFMLSLSEAWEAGLVPIVTSLGAQGERVRDGVDGFTAPPRNAAAVFDLILRLYFDRVRLRQMREVVAQKPRKDVGDHAAAVGHLYARLIAAHPVAKSEPVATGETVATGEPQPHRPASERAGSGAPLTLFDCGVRLNSSRWCWPDNIWDGQEEVVHVSRGRLHYARPGQLSAFELRLPVRSLRTGSPDQHVEVDALEFDGRAATPGSRILAFEDLVIDGWMLGGQGFEPRCTYLRLRGPQGATTFPLFGVNRTDLAGKVAQTAVARAGFRGAINLRGLSEGVYSVDLMQPSAEVMLVCQDITRVTILGQGREPHGETSTWKRSPPSPLGRARSKPIPSGGFRLRQHNLDLVLGHAVGRPADIWWIEAEISAIVPRSQPLLALLQDEMREDVAYEVPVRIDDASAPPNAPVRVEIAGTLNEVPYGTYGLRLASGAGPKATILETGMRLFVSPMLGRFAWSSRSPSFLDKKIRKNAGQRATLEEVALLEDTASARSEHWIVCRGWSFAPGLGSPRCVVFRWQQRRAVRFAICEPLPRADVSAALRDPNAANPGFECCIPRDVLAADRLQVFQCYDQAVVEWIGFDQAVKQRLPAG